MDGTAAHCDSHHDNMTVWVGQHTVEPMDGIPITVCKARDHPMWNGVTWQGYDFQILHLYQDVELNEKVQIACLPTTKDGLDDGSLDGKRLLASGWGDQKHGVADTCPNELHSVELPGYSNGRCQNESDYGPIDQIDWESDRVHTLMCAGEEGKDACQGDSGGPLMYYHEGRATLVGVTSTGDGCGKDRFPGIFARVTSVMDWINEELALNCSDFDQTSTET